MNESPHPLIKYFNYKHLPEHLQVRSKPFHELACTIIVGINEGACGRESTVALRKLLESKDAAVRAFVK